MAVRELTPLVSINIPCYRQLEHARRCVQSILAQTLQDFEVILLDDGASDEYREWAASLGDPRVRYLRNPERLGAMRNMFQAIIAGRGCYSIAFHEDDLLGSRYLEAAVGILDSDPSCGFVGAELQQFEDDPTPAELDRPIPASSVERYPDAAAFVRALMRGVNPMFGSIVYRRSAIEAIVPAHDEYTTLADRPFLLDVLGSWSSAIVRAPGPWRGRSTASGDGTRAHPAPVRPLPCGAAAGAERGRSPSLLRLQRLLAVHAASPRSGGGAVAAAAIRAARVARRAVSPALV